MLLAGATVVCAQAQLFVGGTVGIDYNSSKTTVGSNTTNGPVNSLFQISPMFGYQLSESFALGVKAALGLATTNDRQDTPNKYSIPAWGIEPFVRYSLLNVGNLSLLLEGGVGITGAKLKQSRGSTSVAAMKAFILGVNVQPVLQYKLTDRLRLEAATDLAKLSFAYATSTIPGDVAGGSDDHKTKQAMFGFGVNYTDVFDMEAVVGNTISTPFQIGIIFSL